MVSAKIKHKISAKKREARKKIEEEGKMLGVLYGPKRESTPILVDKREFADLYKEAGESTLITLEIENGKEKASVLIYEIQRDPLKNDILHADFFEPNLKEKVEAEVPLVFAGDSLAVNEMEGTLVKNLYSINVKALPDKLPHEVEVNIGELKTFDDVIYIKDLKVPADVEIVQEEDMVVAMVSKPEDVEEELEKPIGEEEEAEVIGEKEEEGEEEKEEGEEEKEEESKQEEEQK